MHAYSFLPVYFFLLSLKQIYQVCAYLVQVFVQIRQEAFHVKFQPQEQAVQVIVSRVKNTPHP